MIKPNKTCATSEDSDQPAHLHSLIRIFAGHMCLLLAIQRGLNKNHCNTRWMVDVQVDLSLCWSHRSYCRFCHALDQISMYSIICRLQNIHAY